MPGGRLPDAVREAVHVGVLEQIAARPRRQRLDHVVVLGGHRQHHRLDVGVAARDPPQRLQARGARHVEVEHRHRGLELLHQRHGVGAVGGFPHHLHAGILQHPLQAFAEELVVVGDHHAQRIGGSGHRGKIEQSPHPPLGRGRLTGIIQKNFPNQSSVASRR